MMPVALAAGHPPESNGDARGLTPEDPPRREEKSSATAVGNRPAPPAAGGAAPRIRRRNRMITSCLECRRRKLKCDKSHPCANCVKSTRDCLFLAPALDSASQLKLTEIKEKMGSLERVLEQDVAKRGRQAKGADGDEVDGAPEPEDEKDLVFSPLALRDNVYDDNADDDLTDLGFVMGKLRLSERVGGYFRPKMADEVSSPCDGGRPRRDGGLTEADHLYLEGQRGRCPTGREGRTSRSRCAASVDPVGPVVPRHPGPGTDLSRPVAEFFLPPRAFVALPHGLPAVADGGRPAPASVLGVRPPRRAGGAPALLSAAVRRLLG